MSEGRLKRHFIFPSGRSGSNYLANTLNQSPECVNYGEVLGEWTLPYKLIGKFLCDQSGCDRYLNFVYTSGLFFRLAQVYSMCSHLKGGRTLNYKPIGRVSSIGVKDFLVTLERRNGLDFLKGDTDMKIIHLYRTNMLKKYISGLFMGASKVASTYRKMKIEPVEIDIPEMLDGLDVLWDESAREKAFIKSLKGHDILTLEYESYFESRESILRWNGLIFEFLEVAPVNTVSKHQKILPATLKDNARNYTEVVEALVGTPYEGFIY